MTALADYLAALDHPRKADVVAMVDRIAAADPRLETGIKWNAPSFAIDGQHRLTLRLAPRDMLQLILHRDAGSTEIDVGFVDPTGWAVRKAADRYVVDFRGRSVGDEVGVLVRAWLAVV